MTTVSGSTRIDGKQKKHLCREVRRSDNHSSRPWILAATSQVGAHMTRELHIPPSVTGPLRDILLSDADQTGHAANAEVVSWYPKDWVTRYHVEYTSFSSWAEADKRFSSLIFPDSECFLQIDAWWIWKTCFSTIRTSGLVFSELTRHHSWSFTSLDLKTGVSGDYTVHVTPGPGYPDAYEIDLAHWGV